jgi:hypothetical protein
MEPYWTEWRRVVLRPPRTVGGWVIWLLRTFTTLNLTGTLIDRYVHYPADYGGGGHAVLIYVLATIVYVVLLAGMWLLPRWILRLVRRRRGSRTAAP